MTGVYQRSDRRRMGLLFVACCFTLASADREADLIKDNGLLNNRLFQLEGRLAQLEDRHAKELQDVKVQYHQDRERLHHDLLREIPTHSQQSPDYEHALQRIATLELHQAESLATIKEQQRQRLDRDSSEQRLPLMKEMETRLRKDIFEEMASMQLWLQQEYVRATDQVKREHKRALEEVEARMMETHAKDLLDLKTEMIMTVNQHAEVVAALDGKLDMCYSHHVQQANATRIAERSAAKPAQGTSLRGMSRPASYFNPTAFPPGDSFSRDSVTILNATVLKLQARLELLGSSLKCLNQELSNDADLYFIGCNIHVRNGLDDTLVNNARGNLIIGYNEQTSACGVGGNIFCKRSGSHNLILGVANEYTSSGGIVSGHHNEIGGEFASVFGGTLNSAKGYHASVGGGMQNTATGDYAYASGGMQNTVTGNFAQIIGSKASIAKGDFSSVVGGESNTVSSWFGSIIGGQENEANGQYSLIAGGTKDKTLNYKGATVLGGNGKSAEGEYVTL